MLELCWVSLGGFGAAFQGLLSFYFLFLPSPFSSFVGWAEGGEVRSWGCLCSTRWGGAVPPAGTGLILPTGERRESPGVPAFLLLL